MNLHALGRTFQLLGLLILPCSILSELSGSVGLGRSMLIAAAGAGIFYVGIQLQGRS